MLYYAENYNLPLTVYIYIREIDIRMKLFHGYLFWHISRFIFAMVTLSIWRELIYAIVKYVSLIFITCMAGKEKTIAKLVGYHHYFHCKL